MTMKEIVLLTGAGRIGLAIVRHVAAGKRILVGDRATIEPVTPGPPRAS